jgi:hypothetical protein
MLVAGNRSQALCHTRREQRMGSLLISNHRLVSFRDGQATFRWKDYAHGNKQKRMTISAAEFLRRFLWIRA